MHEDFMRLALAQAETAAALGETPVGAVLVENGQVIAAAHNETELHSSLCHAELLALSRAKMANPAACTLYVTLEPCAMCAGAIALSRVGLVVFGAFDKRAGCAGSRYAILGDTAFGPGVPVIGGVLEDDCANILTKFFKAKR